jgi:hypothetical protein
MLLKLPTFFWAEGETDLLRSEQGASTLSGMSLRSSEEFIENFFLWARP